MKREDADERYSESYQYRQRLRMITPAGAQTLSKRPEAFGTDAYPSALVRGEGGRVIDVDGHEYIDLIAGLAAIGIGYSIESINGAVHRQVERGVSFSLPTKLECEVAERLVEIIPCADMVRFVKTGSEACQAAVRIARRYTDNEVVLVCGYHGWHDWYAASKPYHPGVPNSMAPLVDAFPFNDLDELRLRIAENCGHVAAVIMEPTLFEVPAFGYLEGVRKLCDENHIVLIFDEMVTGFRWDEGGYQRYCGVTPDLSTFGKAMANGYPIACVTGRRDLMELGNVISGTFGGEAVGLAACMATMDAYEEGGVIKSLWSAGHRIMREFADAIEGASLSAKMEGWAAHPRIAFKTGDVELDRKCVALFVQEMAAEGVLIHPAGWNVMSEHDNDRDIFAIRNAAEIAAHRVKDALLRDAVGEELLGSAPASGVRA